MENIVKATVYMRNVERDFQAMNEVYEKYFTKGNEPARATIQAPSPLEGVDIEIDVVALAD